MRATSPPEGTREKKKNEKHKNKINHVRHLSVCLRPELCGLIVRFSIHLVHIGYLGVLQTCIEAVVAAVAANSIRNGGPRYHSKRTPRYHSKRTRKEKKMV